MSKQPEALRLAYALEFSLEAGGCSSDAIGLTHASQATADAAAAELRRLHSLNAELLEALKIAEQYVQVEGSELEFDQVRAALAKAETAQ